MRSNLWRKGGSVVGTRPYIGNLHERALTNDRIDILWESVAMRGQRAQIDA